MSEAHHETTFSHYLKNDALLISATNKAFVCNDIRRHNLVHVAHFIHCLLM